MHKTCFSYLIQILIYPKAEGVVSSRCFAFPFVSKMEYMRAVIGKMWKKYDLLIF